MFIFNQTQSVDQQWLSAQFFLTTNWGILFIFSGPFHCPTIFESSLPVVVVLVDMFLSIINFDGTLLQLWTSLVWFDHPKFGPLPDGVTFIFNSFFQPFFFHKLDLVQYWTTPIRAEVWLKFKQTKTSTSLLFINFISSIGMSLVQSAFCSDAFETEHTPGCEQCPPQFLDEFVECDIWKCSRLRWPKCIRPPRSWIPDAMFWCPTIRWPYVRETLPTF